MKYDCANCVKKQHQFDQNLQTAFYPVWSESWQTDQLMMKFFSQKKKRWQLEFTSDFFNHAVPQKNLDLHFLNQVVALLNSEKAFKLTLAHFLIKF